MLADRFLGRAEAQSPRGELVDDDIGAARDQRSLGRRLLGVRGGYVVGGTGRVEQPAGKTSYSHRFEESVIPIVDVDADRLGDGQVYDGFLIVSRGNADLGQAAGRYTRP